MGLVFPKEKPLYIIHNFCIVMGCPMKDAGHKIKIKI